MKKKLVGIFILMLLTATTLPTAGFIVNDNLTIDEFSYFSGSKYSLLNSDYNWSFTEVVSTESLLLSRENSLAVGTDGTVHIAWEDKSDYGGSGSDWDIFYKYKSNDGNWSNTEVVSTESTVDTIYSLYPSLAVEDDGTVHIAWVDPTEYGGSGSDSDIFYKQRSSNGDWSVTEVVSTESTTYSNCPSLDVDSNGTVHVAWDDSTDYSGSGADEDIFYKQKSSSGSWSSLEIISSESTDHSEHPSLDVESDGTVHVAWQDKYDYGGSGIDQDIFYRQRSSSGSWSTVELVSTGINNSSRIPSIAFGNNGEVHVVWYDSTDYGGAGSDLDVFYNHRSTVGIWDTTEVVTIESINNLNNPTLDVGFDGIVHVTWSEDSDYGSSDSDIDIFYKQRSSDGNWSLPEVVSTESTEFSAKPSLVVKPYGTVHISWFDYTDYIGSGGDGDIFYKYRTVEEDIQLIPILDFIDLKVGLIEILHILNLKIGLLGFSVILKNFGEATAYDVTWEMTASGGILYPKTKNGEFKEPIEPGEEMKINIKPLFGFGISTFEFNCKYTMILNSSRSEVDLGVKQEYRGVALGFGCGLPDIVQPSKEWMRIDAADIEYEQSPSPPHVKYVKICYDVETWHNVRVYNEDTGVDFLASCKFLMDENNEGEGILYEDWVTLPMMQNENTYWEIELINGE